MPQPCAIVLVVDRLQFGMLGPYGNTWIETPELNRLASESFLFDQALINCPELELQYNALWRAGGVSPLLSRIIAAPTAQDASLPGLLNKAGVKTLLLTDDPSVASHPLAKEFAEVVTVELPSNPGTAATMEETHLATFFGEAAECWQRAAADPAGAPLLLWLHTQGLGAIWDAPLELRGQYADEEDPAPPEFSDVPCRMLPEDEAEIDPDELWGIAQAYAGQVALLDTCVAALLQQLREGPLTEQTLFTLLSPRGIFLGEHRRVGAPDDALYSQLVHVPWLLRLPDGSGASGRSQTLVQPVDLAATLIDWWGLAGVDARVPAYQGHSLLPIVRGDMEAVRDRAVVRSSSGEHAIRTPAWYLLKKAATPDGESPASNSVELFVKPDDRFEVNEVSGRCPEIVAGLDEALQQLDAASREANAPPLPPLVRVLFEGPD